MNPMDRIRAELRRWQETGELPPAWQPESDDDLDALESGCLDSDDPRHPNHDLACVRPCCARREP